MTETLDMAADWGLRDNKTNVTAFSIKEKFWR
jgi:hypothetical protein